MRDDIFKDKVGSLSARDIGRTAKERRAGAIGYAESMLIEYNRKMKSALKWSKLYANKASSSNISSYAGFDDDEKYIDDDPVS